MGAAVITLVTAMRIRELVVTAMTVVTIGIAVVKDATGTKAPEQKVAARAADAMTVVMVVVHAVIALAVVAVRVVRIRVPAARANVANPAAIAAATAQRPRVAPIATVREAKERALAAASLAASAVEAAVVRDPATSTAMVHETKGLASGAASLVAARAAVTQPRVPTKAPALSKTGAVTSTRANAAINRGLMQAFLRTTSAIALKAPMQTETAQAANDLSALENAAAGGDADVAAVAVVVVGKAAIARTARRWVPEGADLKIRLARNPRPCCRLTAAIASHRKALSNHRRVRRLRLVSIGRQSLQSSGHRLRRHKQ